MRIWFLSVPVLALLAAFLPGEARAQAQFLRGDTNGDGAIDLSDGIQTLSFLFLGGADLTCKDRADFDDTGELDIGDPVNTFGFLFLGARPPAAPYPVFEADPTADDLGCLGAPVEITANITADTTLTKDHSYKIVSIIFVKAPATLTIEAGTTVFGSSTSNPLGVLVVEKGARLVAVGNQTTPVVFTSEKPVGSRHKQDWGGIILLGRADNNISGKEANVEGIVGVKFGPGAAPADDNDSSGRLSYVRIEFGGFALSPDNEVNGLGMYSVGRGTQLDHIICKYVGDDAFEWFGGSAQIKYAIDVGCTDDMYDTSFGTKGRGQFLIGLQNGADTEAGGNGFEMCNAEAPTGNFVTDLPRSTPTWCNVTLCGPGTPKTPSEPGGGNGMLVRRATGGKIYNFIIQGFRNYGVDIDDGLTTTVIDNAEFVADHGIFYKLGLNTNPAGDGYCQLGETGTNEEVAANNFTMTSCDFVNTKIAHLIKATNPPTMDPFNLTAPDWRPQNDASAPSAFDPASLNSSPDNFFDSAPYYGAIAPGTTPENDWSKRPWISYQKN
jgi:hypothetical protein